MPAELLEVLHVLIDCIDDALGKDKGVLHALVDKAFADLSASQPVAETPPAEPPASPAEPEAEPTEQES